MKPKYNLPVIKREYVTINITTGETCNPTSEEKLLDHFIDNNYLTCEILSKIATVTGNTLTEVNNNALKIAEQTGHYDIYVYR
jgi:hypothetical protein